MIIDIHGHYTTAPKALERWRAILARAPADASWRPMVEDAVLAVSPR